MKEVDPQPAPRDDAGLVLLILVLLTFLAVTLLFFGSGWIQVDVG